MSHVLQALSAEQAVRVIEDNLFEFWSFLGRLPYGEFEYSAEMLRYVSGIPIPLFNTIFHARLETVQIDRRIEHALAVFKQRKLPMYWWTGPATRPADLGNYLVKHGLILAEETPGMAADLNQLDESHPIPAGLTVSRVTDDNGLIEWLEPFRQGFELGDRSVSFIYDACREAGFHPQIPLQNYTGYLDGKPVACASIFYGAGVAGIYNVATISEARRKGIGAAMTLLPLLEARANGYHVGVLHASEMGYGVYEQLGFKEYCTLRIYFGDFTNSQVP